MWFPFNTVEHEISACLYIAYIASGAASLYIKTLCFCLFLATGGADVNFRFSGGC